MKFRFAKNPGGHVKKKCNFELKVYNSQGFYLMLELTILLDQL
eukprot:UN24404